MEDGLLHALLDAAGLWNVQPFHHGGGDRTRRLRSMENVTENCHTVRAGCSLSAPIPKQGP